MEKAGGQPREKKQGNEEGQMTYRAPALEKGLDVLELLSRQSEGMILSQIAQSLGRSVQEMYRVVVSLERRGYVVRKPPSEAFQLSIKLFDLAYNHPPMRRLTEAAKPIMNQIAEKTDQAVVLSMLDGIIIRVIDIADNPAPIGFRVRLGTQSPILTTASGRVLLAFQPDAVQKTIIEACTADSTVRGETPEALIKRLELIRSRGYEMVSGETLKGIIDISFPVLDSNCVAHGALTMPFLIWVKNKVQIEAASRLLFNGAADLSREIGGTLSEPKFPLSE